MRSRFFPFLVAVLVIGAFGTSVTSAAQPAVQTSSGPCAALPELPNDFESALACDLRPPAILRFVSALTGVPPRDRKRVFDAAVDAASSPAEREVEAAVAATCAKLDGG